MRLFLNRGDEVPLNSLQEKSIPQEMIWIEDGLSLIDHRIVLRRRQGIAGVEPALIGMKVGGYRKVRISPQLAYRDEDIPDLIPPDAVLVVEIWVHEVVV
jgi:hypothetical protein